MTRAPAADRATLWFGSGRQALYALFSALRARGATRFWLPEYHCMSMVTPCHAAGGETLFYELDAALEPRLETLALARGDVVVAAHYFGRPYDFQSLAARCAAAGAVLVEDAAHVDMTAPQDTPVGTFGEFALYCPRKFAPFYDGATLRGPRAVLATITRATPNWREQAKGLRTLLPGTRRRPGRAPPVAASAATAPAGYVEPRFAVTLRQAATFASRAAQALRFGKARRLRRRRERYAAIHAVAAASAALRPLFAAIPASMTPYVYPAVLTDAADFARLRTRGIDALRWEEFAAPASAALRDLRPALIQLPCSDAMAPQDFALLLNELRALGSRS